MGTWGHGSFQNDHARDWCSSLRNSTEPMGLVRTALVTRQTEGDQARLLAAAEVVAVASGGLPSSDMPRNVAAWIAAGHIKADSRMCDLARAGVEAVRNGSDLRELWRGAGELDDWQTVVEDLLGRLRTREP